jgi:hypothetical protein
MNTPHLPLFDVTESHHGGNPESAGANEIASESKEAIQKRILKFAETRGALGITADEVAAKFKCSHNHVAPRITELKIATKLIASGKKRPTRAGAKAAVLVVPGAMPFTPTTH